MLLAWTCGWCGAEQADRVVASTPTCAKCATRDARIARYQARLERAAIPSAIRDEVP